MSDLVKLNDVKDLLKRCRNGLALISDYTPREKSLVLAALDGIEAAMRECHAERSAWIEAAPAVDAVEVIRCKDCKHYQCAISSLLGEVMCCTRQGNMNVMKEAHDFCSWGERKEE